MLLAKTKELSGSLYVENQTGTTINQGTPTYGQIFYSSIYQNPLTNPLNGLLGFCFEGAETYIDFTVGAKTVWSAKSIFVQCNGKTVEIPFYTEYSNIEKRRLFRIDGDVFNLKEMIGQTVNFKIWWN